MRPENIINETERTVITYTNDTFVNELINCLPNSFYKNNFNIWKLLTHYIYFNGMAYMEWFIQEVELATQALWHLAAV